MADTVVQGSPPSPDGARPSRVKKWAIVAGSVLLALAAAYVTGRLQTAGQTRDAEQKVEATAADCKQSETQVRQLESRRRLSLAQSALEDLNFGIAQSHLTAAGAFLAASGAGPDTDLGKLGAELRAARLVPTDNVGAQKKQLYDWVRRFDDLVPPPKAP